MAVSPSGKVPAQMTVGKATCPEELAPERSMVRTTVHVPIDNRIGSMILKLHNSIMVFSQLQSQASHNIENNFFDHFRLIRSRKSLTMKNIDSTIIKVA